MTNQSTTNYTPEHDQGSATERMVRARALEPRIALELLRNVIPIKRQPAIEPTPVAVATELQAEVANLAERRYITETEARLEQIRAQVGQEAGNPLVNQEAA